MIDNYPAVNFHFIVGFELFPQSPRDVMFQEVSGLNVDVEMEEIKEGGENRFVHQLPTRTKYSDLVLKRGILIDSGVTEWIKSGVEDFEYQPINLLISLLNAEHIPLTSWHVTNAIPKKWEVSSFNAMNGEVVVETITLGYQYFKTISI